MRGLEILVTGRGEVSLPAQVSISEVGASVQMRYNRIQTVLTALVTLIPC